MYAHGALCPSLPRPLSLSLISIGQAWVNHALHRDHARLRSLFLSCPSVHSVGGAVISETVMQAQCTEAISPPVHVHLYHCSAQRHSGFPPSQPCTALQHPLKLTCLHRAWQMCGDP